MIDVIAVVDSDQQWHVFGRWAGINYIRFLMKPAKNIQYLTWPK